MKKTAIHVGVLAAIFIIAVVVFEYMTTRGNDDMMEDQMCIRDRSRYVIRYRA